LVRKDQRALDVVLATLLATAPRAC
jgi:hypothetical protein